MRVKRNGIPPNGIKVLFALQNLCYETGKKKKIYKTNETTGQRFIFGFEFKIGRKNGGDIFNRFAFPVNYD